jgi:hypothetical protein
MPALDNPRWEAFAQAIVKGLASDKPNGKNTQKAAYLAAGYSPRSDHAAENSASRLMRNVGPVVERIRELQEQALARVDRKLDISRERIGRRLDLASRMAEQENKPETIVSSELGLAKVFGLAKTSESYNPGDMSNAKSADDLGRLLLESIGASPPFTAQEIASAIKANDVFVESLESIRDVRVQV